LLSATKAVRLPPLEPISGTLYAAKKKSLLGVRAVDARTPFTYKLLINDSPSTRARHRPPDFSQPSIRFPQLITVPPPEAPSKQSPLCLTSKSIGESIKYVLFSRTIFFSPLAAAASINSDKSSALEFAHAKTNNVKIGRRKLFISLLHPCFIYENTFNISIKMCQDNSLKFAIAKIIFLQKAYLAHTRIP